MPLVSSSGNATGLGSSQSIANTTGGLSAGFSFGSTSKTSSTAAPSLYQFGATSTAASSSTSTPAAGFTFGAPSGISTGSSAPFGASTTLSAAQSPFGAPVASSNTVASIFGTSSNSQMPFGTQTSNAATVFSFGANQKTTNAASIFTLSAGPTSSTAGASLFGSQPASSSTAGFSFGVGGNQTATGLQFGNKPQTSSVFGAINAASPFGTTSSAAPAFGSTNQTQAFGLSNQTPAFGSTNQTPAFGSTNQTSAFGLTNQTLSFGSSNQTPAFGSSNQTAAFGSTNQTPAFVLTNQTPAFGSTSQAPAFGQSNSISGFGASSNPASVFGSGFAASTQKSNTPVFGASTNTASNSVFGNTGTPGFGKSQSMPAFGTSDSTLSGFNFGGPAPNVNPFGQGPTTPLKQTGSAFGMPSVDTTPKNQTGAMFQFGQSQNNNSSASKGFDFGAGASGSNTGGFNFTFSSSSMPGFNFMGTATGIWTDWTEWTGCSGCPGTRERHRLCFEDPWGNSYTTYQPWLNPWYRRRRADHLTDAWCDGEAQEVQGCLEGCPRTPHVGVRCDVCKVSPIRGIRWRCSSCPDYDMCSTCYEDKRRMHDMSHSFFKKENSTKGTKEQKGEHELPKTSSCLPSHWMTMKPDQHVIKVDLSTMSEEFRTVMGKFVQTLRKRIVRIHRVQNKFLWEFYCSKRKQMDAIDGKIGGNEMNLFHGTKPDIIQTVCAHNLDMRLAGTNVGAIYGNGAYFASTAEMSDWYATADPKTGHKFMLQCRVLVGRWTKGQQGLRRPPEVARTPDGQVRLYDSCVDDVRNPNIFCIFDHVQYYPEYIIEYK